MLITPKNTTRCLQIFILGVMAYMTMLSAFAALPVINPPSGGGIGGAQVANNDILAIIGAYFKQGITIFAYILVAISGLVVIIGSMVRWRKYSAGQMELGDVKEYLISGVILVIFIALLAKWGLDAMA